MLSVCKASSSFCLKFCIDKKHDWRQLFRSVISQEEKWMLLQLTILLSLSLQRKRDFLTDLFFRKLTMLVFHGKRHEHDSISCNVSFCRKVIVSEAITEFYLRATRRRHIWIRSSWFVCRQHIVRESAAWNRNDRNITFTNKFLPLTNHRNCLKTSTEDYRKQN